MNTELQAKFDAMHASLDALEEQLAAEREAADRVRERQEELTQQFWSQSRKLATLQEGQARVADLQVRVKRYEALLKETRTRLRGLLGYTKALGEETQT